MRNRPAVLLTVVSALVCLSPCRAQQSDGHDWSAQPDTPAGEKHVWKIRSCTLCESIQKIEALSPPIMSSIDFDRIVGKEWHWQYKGKNYHACPHEWRRGVSRAVRKPITNGQVVLVRKGEVYGAFILTGQTTKPESARYIWRYGTGSGGGFTTNDPNVKWSDTSESVQNRKGELTIGFGPFEILWSGSVGDKSWICYAKNAGEVLDRNDLAICVTEEHSFDNIRPQDAKWRYRRSPVDEQNTP